MATRPYHRMTIPWLFFKRAIPGRIAKSPRQHAAVVKSVRRVENPPFFAARLVKRPRRQARGGGRGPRGRDRRMLRAARTERRWKNHDRRDDRRPLRADRRSIELFGLPGQGARRRDPRALRRAAPGNAARGQAHRGRGAPAFPLVLRKGAPVDELIALLSLEAERDRYFSRCRVGRSNASRSAARSWRSRAALPRRADDGARSARAQIALDDRREVPRNGPQRAHHDALHGRGSGALRSNRRHGRGQIIARGTPRSLVDSLGMVQFVEFEVARALDEKALGALPSVASVVCRGQHYRLEVDRSLAA